MTATSYDYDVAISFLAADQPLALQVSDALAPLRVFVYSKAQEEVAGAEGVEAFREVFRHRARVSLVLFRPGWAQTKWTRVEEAAIRDHCLDAGWDHLMFVRLTRDGEIPKWVPDSYIYLDFSSFGLSDLVGAVKAKLARFGVELRPPSPTDRARQVADAERFQRETRELMRASPAPFVDAAAVLFAELHKILAEIEVATGWEIKRGSHGQGQFVARSGGVSMQLLAREVYVNRCDGAFLLLRLLSGTVLTPQERGMYYVFDEPSELSTKEFHLRRVAELGWCWEYGGAIYTSEAAAGRIADDFVRELEQQGKRDP
jgi:hypothetical protein